jgi:outer membrane protein
MRLVKILVFGMLFILVGNAPALAQRFAYIDSEYILGEMPEYAAAQSELDVLAERWSKELAEKRKEVDRMYRAYKAEQVLMTEKMRKEREEEISKKEAEIDELQRKRFGYEGELFVKQKELIKPIQDKIYEAVQKYARDKGYDIIFDRAGEFTMLYANSRLDKSDEVLEAMGVAKKTNRSTGSAGTPSSPTTRPKPGSK